MMKPKAKGILRIAEMYLKGKPSKEEEDTEDELTEEEDSEEDSEDSDYPEDILEKAQILFDNEDEELVKEKIKALEYLIQHLPCEEEEDEEPEAESIGKKIDKRNKGLLFDEK